MTAVPGGIIECIPPQASLAMVRDLSASSSCDRNQAEKLPSLSLPLQLDELNRTVTLTYSPLSQEFKDQIMCFKSACTPLLQFLKKDALIYEELGNTCTTLFFEESTHELVGFCSTKCSSLKMKGRKICSLCPSIEIAALCVSDKFRYMGIGQAILYHTIQQIYKIKQLVGVQVVTLFALPEAVAFYQKFSFRKLAKEVKIFYSPAHQRCIPMYLTLANIPLEQSSLLQLTSPLTIK